MKITNIINPLRVALAVLIMAIPLYPKFPLAGVNGVYVNIRLDDILVAISLLVWCVYQIMHKAPIKKQSVFWVFCAYLAGLLIAASGNILIHRTEPISLVLFHTFRRLEYISVFFVTLSALKTLKELKFVLLFFVISLVGIDFYGLGQKFFNFPVVSTMNEEFSKGQILTISVWTRINSTFAGHYDLAVYMSVALVLLLGIITLSKKIWLKILLLLVWLLSFYILTLTASRVSIFAFWTGAMIALLLIRKWLWILPVTGLVIFSIFNSQELNQRLAATIPTIKSLNIHLPAISLFSHNNNTGSISFVISPTPTFSTTSTTGGGLVPITSIKPGEPTPTITRVRPVEEYPKVDQDLGVARSGEIRFKVEWPRAMKAFSKNPLQGTGPSSLGLATDNEFLRVLGESGIIGISTFMFIFVFFTLKTKPRIAKKSSDSLERLKYVFFAAMLTMLGNATFIDVFAASKTAYTFWIMMGIYYVLLNLPTTDARNKA